MKLLERWFCPATNEKQQIALTEGMYADDYRCPVIREQIQAAYKQSVTKKVSPLTAPEIYDPLDPPQGWRYDPYYELWIEYEHNSINSSKSSSTVSNLHSVPPHGH